jgi:phenylacetate-CoA ligase
LGYLDPVTERMPQKELRMLQEKKLRQLMLYLKAHSSFYRKRFKEAGVDFEDVRTLEDLKKLPFTFKRDFRENYPVGMFCVPPDRIACYHASSGTTGKPTIVGYTRSDVEQWSTSLARGLTSLGIGRGDLVQNSYGYGLFTGGLGFHYAAEMVEATILPIGTGGTERQIEFMRDLGSTIIACTPSYFLHLAEVARGLGVDFRKDTKLRAGLFGAEPWSEDMRKRIEGSTGIKAYDVYGTSELGGPLFTECRFQNGIHVWSDLYIVEIVDPETGEVLGEGEKGELVATTLSKEALPLVRYRTGDVTYLNIEECECGRTHPRIMRIHGRTDDMLVIRGINVFPSQVESVLMRIPELSENYQLIVDREHELDKMTVRVEVDEKAYKGMTASLDEVRRKAQAALKNVLNLSVEVELAEPGSIPRSTGKAKRVIDRRKI